MADPSNLGVPDGPPPPVVLPETLAQFRSKLALCLVHVVEKVSSRGKPVGKRALLCSDTALFLCRMDGGVNRVCRLWDVTKCSWTRYGEGSQMEFMLHVVGDPPIVWRHLDTPENRSRDPFYPVRVISHCRYFMMHEPSPLPLIKMLTCDELRKDGKLARSKRVPAEQLKKWSNDASFHEERMQRQQAGMETARSMRGEKSTRSPTAGEPPALHMPPPPTEQPPEQQLPEQQQQPLQEQQLQQQQPQQHDAPPTRAGRPRMPGMPLFDPAGSSDAQRLLEQGRGELEPLADGATFQFPADEAFWANLLQQADKSEVSRRPPLLQVTASHEEGRKHLLNVEWTRSFVSGWERTNPHVVTIQTPEGSAIFRSSDEFWKEYAQKLPPAVEGEPAVHIAAGEAGALATTVKAWNDVCDKWEEDKACGASQLEEQLWPHRLAPGQVTVVKAPGQELGLCLSDDMTVVDVVPDSPSSRAGANKYVGRKLLTVGDGAVQSPADAEQLARGGGTVPLTFGELVSGVQVDWAGDDDVGMVLDPALRLVDVRPHSPADRAGTSRFIGKRLTHVDGAPVSSRQDLEQHMAPNMTLVFNPRSATPTVALGENEVLLRRDGNDVGLTVASNAELGLAVTAVTPGGPADRAGCSRFVASPPAYLLTHAAGVPVRTMEELRDAAAEEGDTLLLRFEPLPQTGTPAGSDIAVMQKPPQSRDASVVPDSFRGTPEAPPMPQPLPLPPQPLPLPPPPPPPLEPPAPAPPVPDLLSAEVMRAIPADAADDEAFQQVVGAVTQLVDRQSRTEELLCTLLTTMRERQQAKDGRRRRRRKQPEQPPAQPAQPSPADHSGRVWSGAPGPGGSVFESPAPPAPPPPPITPATELPPYVLQARAAQPQTRLISPKRGKPPRQPQQPPSADRSRHLQESPEVQSLAQTKQATVLSADLVPAVPAPSPSQSLALTQRDQPSRLEMDPSYEKIEIDLTTGKLRLTTSSAAE
eukprot:TRINITY_DN3700_c3_g1_i1.p1 TRINITY_DN3700_c3_g1~~TRINITY_DN3700_c3_g1_i1.p1  ORF type:complete len:1000 (+),score=398.85 TRINITY_DN3700_c3_g1_i1:53-3001(+)